MKRQFSPEDARVVFRILSRRALTIEGLEDQFVDFLLHDEQFFEWHLSGPYSGLAWFCSKSGIIHYHDWCADWMKRIMEEANREILLLRT